MATMTLDPLLTKSQDHHGPVLEEITGLIKVYQDGHVERPQLVPHVSTNLPPELQVTSRDLVINNFTNIWARFYIPHNNNNLPILLYFHGGGFCVGSAAWSCYHHFLAKLSHFTGCVIMSLNYRLAPEHPLPAAYEDGLEALIWLKHQAQFKPIDWLPSNCNDVLLAGDSAGANIAYNVSTRIGSTVELNVLGCVLIQPFFGGETRTGSEKYMKKEARSALTLAASDSYWRLALPRGANRDHPWCNPCWTDVMELPATMVCVSEMDILRDRNLEFCGELERAGKVVECVMYEGVGHAFQVLNKSRLAQMRVREMMVHIKDFISRWSPLS